MIKPFILGAVMAAMMLWMGHEQIMTGGISASFGTLLFVLAHVAVVALVSLVALIFPKVRGFFGKHRPSVPHIAIMLSGMVFMAGAIHLVVHGGLS